jgi:uncharacterized protein YfiM (DUF2279 family)
MRTFAALLLLTMASLAYAAPDSWTGPDKKMHLAAGATIAGTVSFATGNKLAGFAVGTLAGALKEGYDDRHRDVHTVSYRDFLVTVAGAGIATTVPGLTVLPGGVVYRRSF